MLQYMDESDMLYLVSRLLCDVCELSNQISSENITSKLHTPLLWHVLDG
jgi:hypothetical protein